MKKLILLLLFSLNLYPYIKGNTIVIEGANVFAQYGGESSGGRYYDVNGWYHYPNGDFKDLDGYFYYTNGDYEDLYGNYYTYDPIDGGYYDDYGGYYDINGDYYYDTSEPNGENFYGGPVHMILPFTSSITLPGIPFQIFLNACVPASFEYIGKIYGSEKTMIDYAKNYQKKYNINPYVYGVIEANVINFTNSYFQTEICTDFKSSINAGYPVMAALITDLNKGEGHNVLIIGYDINNGYFKYADTGTGKYGTAPISFFSMQDALTIKGLK